MKTLFRHADLVTPGLEIRDGAMLICDDRIAGLYDASEEPPEADRIFDLSGMTLLPGFFDIHFHGRDNCDFSDASPEAIRTIARGKLSEGVTSFLVTTLTLGYDTITEICRSAARYAENPEFGRPLGLHLEGPFLNPEGAGAQNPAFLHEPEIAPVLEWNRIYPIRKVSFSPELRGGIAFARRLSEAGIMPSGAHSTADLSCFQKARIAGMKHLTHFCNVMTPLHHLHPGMVGGGLLADDVLVELIADGVHLTEEMLRVILRMKGPERIMLITDAMRASGMPEGTYTLGGLDVQVKGGRAALPSGRIAGSLLHFCDGLKRLRALHLLPDSELIRCAGSNQAKSLGIPGIGELKTGFHADFILADKDWTPCAVWCRGRLQYRIPGFSIREQQNPNPVKPTKTTKSTKPIKTTKPTRKGRLS